jgi:oxygen-independent coproporphyrinogen III oxidase
VKNKRTEKNQNHNQPLEPWNPGILEPFLEVSSLYIHIPFCVKKCGYCDFFSVLYNESLAHAYTDALCKELYLKSKSANRLKSIYIGGGTPSLLPDKCFSQIFSCLRDNFQISHDAEISVEANPGTFNQSKVNLLLSLEVNRMSLGVQSFNDDELKFLGRIHTADDALRSLGLIRNSGLQNYSLDLMYGILGQSINSWCESIAKAVDCSPKHISTYELTLEEGTPLYNILKIPEEDIILDMYNHTIDFLASHVYEQYEISNFAQPGFQCFHNLNYWDRGGYIGAGAGAHSFINEIRSNNVKDIRDYVERLNSGLIPETELSNISPAEALKEFLFLGLRKTTGISINKTKRLGMDIISASEDMLEAGYFEVKDDSLRLTRKGIVLSNLIIVRLFGNLGL